MTDFLAEIDAAYTEHLLASGNLNPKRKSNNWSGEKSWSRETVCRIHMYSCTHCGAQHQRFLGFFERTVSPSGTSAEKAIPRPKETVDPIYSQSSVDACIDCFNS